MTNKELRELDAWIAEHVIGMLFYWKVAGWTTDMSGFDWKMVLALPPEGGIGKHWKGCAGETRKATDCEVAIAKHDGDFERHFSPYTTDPAAAMMVLEKCVENSNMPVEIDRKRDSKIGHWRLETGVMSKGLLAIAPHEHNTLPLAICLFAKKLFSK
jgi:hypothetical protein